MKANRSSNHLNILSNRLLNFHMTLSNTAPMINNHIKFTHATGFFMRLIKRRTVKPARLINCKEVIPSLRSPQMPLSWEAIILSSARCKSSKFDAHSLSRKKLMLKGKPYPKQNLQFLPVILHFDLLP